MRFVWVNRKPHASPTGVGIWTVPADGLSSHAKQKNSLVYFGVRMYMYDLRLFGGIALLVENGVDCVSCAVNA